jgi:lysophospholipase L1-like esterase
MIQQIKFYLGALLLIPFLPLLLWQGKRLRKRIPDLPEAAGSRTGTEGQGTNQFNILILGESTMAGVGVEHQKDGIARQIALSLSHKMEAEIHWQVVARSGYNAKKVLDELVPQIPDIPLDAIIIGLGVNDAVERNSPQGWQRDFGAVLHAIREKQNCPIIMANRAPVEHFPAFPPVFKLVLGSLIQWFWQLLPDLKNQIADFYIIEETIELEDWQTRIGRPAPPEEFFSDGVHPSKLTYRLWAEEIATFIADHQLLRIKAST